MRFLDCREGRKDPSKSILDVGVKDAIRFSGFDEKMFLKRGGKYVWSKADMKLEWWKSAKSPFAQCVLHVCYIHISHCSVCLKSFITKKHLDSDFTFVFIVYIYIYIYMWRKQCGTCVNWFIFLYFIIVCVCVWDNNHVTKLKKHT